MMSFLVVRSCPKLAPILLGTVPSLRSLLAKNCARRYSVTHNSLKVTVVGAAGNIGQSLSLMLKQCPLIDELSLHDVKHTVGLAADLNNVDTKCVVTASPQNDLKTCLQGSDIVVIIASAAHTDRLDYNARFDRNAPIVKDITMEIAKTCPKALIAVGTEPVNSMVPLVSEVLKRHGHYSPNVVFGLTTIDVVRANTFVAEVLGLEPECVFVPVIGGHSANTIVPVLSQAIPCNEFTVEELEDITVNVRNARTNIVQVAPTSGSGLSSAFSMARCIISMVKGLRGQQNIVECALVKSQLHPQLKYMVSPLLLGPGGVMKNLGMPALTDYEHCLLENAVQIMMNHIKRGEEYGGRKEKPICDPCDSSPRAPPCPPDHCAIKAIMTGGN